ncbi:hypothetical protein DFH27DRAFT_331166 [Peziza echinospora]|nr:hypothetical protein DFH27DRAFT_331166 [Peziza echinospora]
MVYASPASGPQMIEIDTDYEGDITLPSPTWTSASALEALTRNRRRLQSSLRSEASTTASSGDSTPENTCKGKGNGTPCPENCPCKIDVVEYLEAQMGLADGETNPLHEALMKIKDRRYRGVRVERKIEKRIGKAIRLRRRKPDYSAQDERAAKGKERLRQPRPHVPPPSPPGTSTSDLMGKLGEIHFDASSTLDGVSSSTYYEGLDFDLEEYNDVYMQSPKESPRQSTETCEQSSRVPTEVAPWIPDDLDTCTTTTTTTNPPPIPQQPACSADEQEFSNQSTPISLAGLGKSPMPYDPSIIR